MALVGNCIGLGWRISCLFGSWFKKLPKYLPLPDTGDHYNLADHVILVFIGYTSGLTHWSGTHFEEHIFTERFNTLRRGCAWYTPLGSYNLYRLCFVSTFCKFH